LNGISVNGEPLAKKNMGLILPSRHTAHEADDCRRPGGDLEFTFSGRFLQTPRPESENSRERTLALIFRRGYVFPGHPDAEDQAPPRIQPCMASSDFR
jgi:hypothetical protein